MIAIDPPKREAERAMLVAVIAPGETEETAAELLAELGELTDTFGAAVVDSRIIPVPQPKSRYFIGSGKAEQLVEEGRRQKIDIIIFDHDLTPSQQRNWEQLAGIPVIDRREVILDIFAARASTPEAVLQIDLARSQYMLPRLKRAWTHLSRQRGNTKMRGEGEKQIEMDERMVRQRIARLRQQLHEVRRRRLEQRKKRRQRPVPNGAIVGYTNAGKSSLLNHLTQANVLVEDRLFATLDPTTRRVVLPNNQTLLLTDTVGFVRKLPHSLVESFKATLEEAAVADFLIHVLDVTSPDVEAHVRTTSEVLQEIGAADSYTLTVFNKVDLLPDRHRIRRLRRLYPDALFISSVTGEGVDLLIAEMQRLLDEQLRVVDLAIPHRHYALVARLHRTSHIMREEYEDDGISIHAAVPFECWQEIEPFIVTESVNGVAAPRRLPAPAPPPSLRCP